MAMTKVAEVVVGSGGAASIEFTNIPQTGKDLLVKWSLRYSGGNNNNIETFYVRLNSITSGYSVRQLEGTGSSTASWSYSGSGFLYFYMNGNLTTSNTFTSGETYLSNYTSSAAKSASFDNVVENNATAGYQQLVAGSSTNTAAVTGLTIFSDSDNFAQHSTASLYIIS